MSFLQNSDDVLQDISLKSNPAKNDRIPSLLERVIDFQNKNTDARKEIFEIYSREIKDIPFRPNSREEFSVSAISEQQEWTDEKNKSILIYLTCIKKIVERLIGYTPDSNVSFQEFDQTTFEEIQLILNILKDCYRKYKDTHDIIMSKEMYDYLVQ